MMNSNSLAGLLWHFPGSMLFVISLMTTSYAIASLLPYATRRCGVSMHLSSSG